MSKIDSSEDIPVNPRPGQGAVVMQDLIAARLGRRSFLGGFAAASLGGCASLQGVAGAKSGASKSSFTFPEITRGLDQTHHVPDSYRADILIRWGDPLFADSPKFDPARQTAAAQERQFGYNNDFIGIVPLPKQGNTDRALLCVNHEYTSTPLMFPNVAAGMPGSITREQCLVEMAAHGGSILEIEQKQGRWSVVVGSRFNRRITAHTTPMQFAGPAAGHPRLQTSEDPKGQMVGGMMNNCAGGITPWGTYVTAEENINGNFLGTLAAGHPETANHKRMGVPGGWYQWGRYVDRFDIGKEPNEPNRYGWIVEIDPFDPASTPKKRTALGRFKHEGCESVVAPDGRVVVYMGDDQRFEYVYKFVTKGRFNPRDMAANRDLLDDGTLYVARFGSDGFVDWLPLTFGTGPLLPENGFQSQADVVIDARRAADLLGATPMDRPEDVEPDRRTGRVWVMCTNNDRRKTDQVNAANPRAENRSGHIIEIRERDGDFTAIRSAWEILVRCGDPANPAVNASWNPATSANGWFGSPDNCAMDPQGRLWVATDGNDNTGAADGLWAMETDGPRRGTGKAFFRAPAGAEVCGPRFMPDGNSLFLSVQHPGDGVGSDTASYEQPTTRWPDFVDGAPPRPSVVVITRTDGRTIGT
jgi:uncharacterized protein